MSEDVRVKAKGILFDMDGVLVSSIGSVVRCWRQWAEHYEVPNAEIYEVPHGMRAIEIVKALLESLPVERWAIVTSATRRLLLGRLKAAGLPIPERIISADMVERGKPDPEPYRRGAELLGLRPEDCLVVEDAPSGVGAGLAAGSRVLGVVGTHTAEDLDGAEWIVGSLEGVKVTVVAEGLELRFTPLA